MSPRNPTPLQSLLLPLKPASLQCLHRFIEYKRTPLAHPVPKRRTAAVAIILFVGRKGDLYVLLSTRSGELRTYAHDTALPGGKYEDGDENEEGTARREAYEEIGLPIDTEKVRCLTLLDPFVAGNQLIVTPVVFLVTDNTINPVLNPDEVTSLFSMPLAAFLHDRPADIPGWNFGLSERVNPAPLGTVPPPERPPYTDNEDGGVGGRDGRYYQYRDVNWGGGMVRMHRFLTGREGGGVKPVYGLTAAILLHAAMVGYGEAPSFPPAAPGQRTMVQRIAWMMKRGGALPRAAEAEGLLAAWLDEDDGGGVDEKAKL
ncbi:hypothetical protein VHUM_01523 [Vanrija humicola]|uniref:Nudix hydrolase domain-containing protein n=1 Tax=Vanrija humicola TaxID=5417 RepID=A0A7D8V2J9_VANHU|nr:hypothetical protein VHUM_01523 [Vanrija humicola]